MFVAVGRVMFYKTIKVMLLHRIYSSACHPFSKCQLKCVSATSVIALICLFDLHQEIGIGSGNTVEKETKEVEEKIKWQR